MPEMRKSLKCLKYILPLCMYVVTNSVVAQIGSIIGPNPSAEREIGYRTAKLPPKKPAVNRVTVLKHLALDITRCSNTENEKAKAIFLWIAKNIGYDNELRNDVKLQKEFYVSEDNVVAKVLERKKALCGGYAFLYRSLCGQVGIEATIVHGFSQNYSAQLSSTNKPNHTWNSVKLNGKWYLLDITMAISHGTPDRPDVYWFKTEPVYFIKTHYPLTIERSLLKYPMSRKEFETLAKG